MSQLRAVGMGRDADTLSDRPAPRAGAEQVWLTSIYRDHFAAVRALIARKHGAGPPDPEDVVQAAFVRLAKIDAQNQGSIIQPRGFLARMAENILLDEKRKLAVRARHAGEAYTTESVNPCVEVTVENVLIAREELALINKTLNAMSERRRQCFILHRFEELSIAEIGRRLRISPTAARYHLVQALAEIEEAVHG